ncbi:hypothetical protein Lser_V15G16514 [Lactuca serriola]
MALTEISGKFALELAKFVFGLAAGSQYLLPGADEARSFKLDPNKEGFDPAYLSICWMAANLIAWLMSVMVISIEVVTETGCAIGNVSVKSKNKWRRSGLFLDFLSWILHLTGSGFHLAANSYSQSQSDLGFLILVLSVIVIIVIVFCSMIMLYKFWKAPAVDTDDNILRY